MAKLKNEIETYRGATIVDTITGLTFEIDHAYMKDGEKYFRVDDKEDKSFHIDLKDNENYMVIDKDSSIANGSVENWLKAGKDEAYIDAVASRIFSPDGSKNITMSEVFTRPYLNAEGKIDNSVNIGIRYEHFKNDLRDMDKILLNKFGEKKLGTDKAVEARIDGINRLISKYDLGRDVLNYKNYQELGNYADAVSKTNSDIKSERSISEIARQELKIDTIKEEMENYEAKHHFGKSLGGVGLGVAGLVVATAFAGSGIGLIMVAVGAIKFFKGLFKTYENKMEKNYYKELKNELKQAEKVQERLADKAENLKDNIIKLENSNLKIDRDIARQEKRLADAEKNGDSKKADKIQKEIDKLETKKLDNNKQLENARNELGKIASTPIENKNEKLTDKDTDKSDDKASKKDDDKSEKDSKDSEKEKSDEKESKENSEKDKEKSDKDSEKKEDKKDNAEKKDDAKKEIEGLKDKIGDKEAKDKELQDKIDNQKDLIDNPDLPDKERDLASEKLDNLEKEADDNKNELDSLKSDLDKALEDYEKEFGEKYPEDNNDNEVESDNETAEDTDVEDDSDESESEEPTDDVNSEESDETNSKNDTEDSGNQEFEEYAEPVDLSEYGNNVYENTETKTYDIPEAREDSSENTNENSTESNVETNNSVDSKVSNDNTSFTEKPTLSELKVEHREEVFASKLEDSSKECGETAQFKGIEDGKLSIEVMPNNLAEANDGPVDTYEIKASNPDKPECLNSISSNGVEAVFSKDVINNRIGYGSENSLRDMIGKSVMSKEDNKIEQIKYMDENGNERVCTPEDKNIPVEVGDKIKDMIGEKAFNSVANNFEFGTEVNENVENQNKKVETTDDIELTSDELEGLKETNDELTENNDDSNEPKSNETENDNDDNGESDSNDSDEQAPGTTVEYSDGVPESFDNPDEVNIPDAETDVNDDFKSEDGEPSNIFDDYEDDWDSDDDAE